MVNDQWAEEAVAVEHRVFAGQGHNNTRWGLVTEEKAKAFVQSHACRKFHSRCFSWKELGRKFNSSNVHSIWDSWKSVKRRKTQRLLMSSAPNLKKQSPIECSNTNFHMEQEVGPETHRDSACWRQCWVHKGKKIWFRKIIFSFSKENFKTTAQGKIIEGEWQRILGNVATAVTDLLKAIFQEMLITSRIPLKSPCLIWL